LQYHRTSSGHAYNVGYPPSSCSDASVTDAAFTDDLRLVGTGLVAYLEQTGRQDVLESAVRLADYYLRPHIPGTANGAFLESLGTWCIGPWPVEIAAEHLPRVRMDKAGWGFTAQGAVRFLTLLHSKLSDGHSRAELMSNRCVRSVQWQFSCQFDDGAVGLCGRDDKWLGMTAAAILAYLDVRDAGWLADPADQDLAGRATKAKEWLLDNTDEEMIDQGGYVKVSGQTTPHPPENLAWLLALTADCLLRLDEL